MSIFFLNALVLNVLTRSLFELFMVATVFSWLSQTIEGGTCEMPMSKS